MLKYRVKDLAQLAEHFAERAALADTRAKNEGAGMSKRTNGQADAEGEARAYWDVVATLDKCEMAP